MEVVYSGLDNKQISTDLYDIQCTWSVQNASMLYTKSLVTMDWPHLEILRWRDCLAGSGVFQRESLHSASPPRQCLGCQRCPMESASPVLEGKGALGSHHMVLSGEIGTRKRDSALTLKLEACVPKLQGKTKTKN